MEKVLGEGTYNKTWEITEFEYRYNPYYTVSPYVVIYDEKYPTCEIHSDGTLTDDYGKPISAESFPKGMIDSIIKCMEDLEDSVTEKWDTDVEEIYRTRRAEDSGEY